MTTTENSDIILYPGRVIGAGEKNAALVKELQRRLNELGCGPLVEDGSFGPMTAQAVSRFQARAGVAADGLVGPGTWNALFPPDPAPASGHADPLLAAAVAKAATQVGVMEQPLGSNRGPQVDEYLRRAGLNPAAGSFPWCVAFVYYCFDEAAKTLGRANPLVKTASVWDLWGRSGQKGGRQILPAAAAAHPEQIQPGYIFLLKFGNTGGHAGLVERVAGDTLVTIEGNSNAGGSREGVGVFRRTSRKIVKINFGFLDYSAR